MITLTPQKKPVILSAAKNLCILPLLLLVLAGVNVQAQPPKSTANGKISGAATYALIVAIELSLIVSENNNGAASIPAPLPPDVVGGVEHGSGDIGAAVESLVAKQPVKPALHFLAAIVK